MIVVVGRVQTDAARRDELIRLGQAVAAASREEAAASAIASTRTPSRSTASCSSRSGRTTTPLQRHFATDHIATFMGALPATLAAPPDVQLPHGRALARPARRQLALTAARRRQRNIQSETSSRWRAIAAAPNSSSGRTTSTSEAGGLEAAGEVGRVEAHVVVLAEGRGARLGADDRRVLVGLRALDVERDEHEAPAARRGDAAQLAHRRGVLGARARGRASRSMASKAPSSSARPVTSSSRSTPAGSRSPVTYSQARGRRERPAQAVLGREVQQAPRVAEQLGPAAEQQPLRAVALVRAAAPAQHAGPVPVVLEAGERAAADRARDLVAAMAHVGQAAREALTDSLSGTPHRGARA